MGRRWPWSTGKTSPGRGSSKCKGSEKEGDLGGPESHQWLVQSKPGRESRVDEVGEVGRSQIRQGQDVWVI